MRIFLLLMMLLICTPSDAAKQTIGDLYVVNNVGIGTINPQQRLEVVGTVKATSFVGDGSALTGITGGSGLSGLTAGKVLKASSETTAVDSAIYENGGNVGIGTTIPVSALHVSSSSGVIIDGTAGSLVGYNSEYPPAHNTTYVKGTYYLSYYNHIATNPATSLTGSSGSYQWYGTGQANQTFHIDLGSAKTITRIYYENGHISGAYTDKGAKTFTFWGSNTVGDFNDTVYANNGTWTQITASQSTFDQHTASNVADPKYITVTNSTAYRYYRVKVADVWGGNDCTLRRIELQTSVYAANPSLVFNAVGTQTAKVWTDGYASNKFKIDVATTNRITIDSIGNIGIGTTTPVNKLDVYGGVVIGTPNAGAIIAPTNGLLVSGNVGIGTTASTSNLTLRGTISSNGNVGVSTTATTTCGCKVYTNGLCTTIGTCS